MCLEDALVSLSVALLWWWLKQEMWWDTGLVPGHQGKLVGSWIQMTWKVPLSDHRVTLILFIWCQLCLLPERTRRRYFFKMQQKTQTYLQQRGNGFCIKYCRGTLVFQCQLSWLLSFWGREDSKVNQQQQDGASTRTSISAPKIQGRSPGASGGGPGGRHRSREPQLGKGCEHVHAKGYPTDRSRSTVASTACSTKLPLAQLWGRFPSPSSYTIASLFPPSVSGYLDEKACSRRIVPLQVNTTGLTQLCSEVSQLLFEVRNSNLRNLGKRK